MKPVTFGQRFKALRLERALNQDELSQDFERVTGKSTNKASISHYETDKRKPEIDTLEAWAEYFSCSVDYLLGRTHIKDAYDIHTIAAHHDGDEWTAEELEEIEQFKAFVKARKAAKATDKKD